MKHMPQLLMMAALVIFLLETAPSQSSGVLDHLLTLAMVAAVWIAVRRQLFSRGLGGFARKPESNDLLDEEDQEEEPVEAPQPISQDMLHHNRASWTVVEQGDSLGTFREHPIPAWIRTSDGRQAFYAGITQVILPEEYACVEFPSRGEIIIPPGIIYALTR